MSSPSRRLLLSGRGSITITTKTLILGSPFLQLTTSIYSKFGMQYLEISKLFVLKRRVMRRNLRRVQLLELLKNLFAFTRDLLTR